MRREKIRIVTTKLLKMGGKKKRENCGNEVAGNEGEKKRFRPKIEGKKNCDN